MSIVKRESYGLEKTSTKSEIGTGLLVAGGGGLGLVALAAVLPGGVFALCVFFVLLGIVLKLV